MNKNVILYIKNEYSHINAVIAFYLKYLELEKQGEYFICDKMRLNPLWVILKYLFEITDDLSEVKQTLLSLVENIILMAYSEITVNYEIFNDEIFKKNNEQLESLLSKARLYSDLKNSYDYLRNMYKEAIRQILSGQNPDSVIEKLLKEYS